ncbi:3-hydroxyacyl-CoA dehydrogenase NAD-binding domain-containing protein [Nesterenkonia flava]|uniref:3-hydroxyacyl-CoA dehydrogenase NAD-binding domain-containing protein n=1 Tax=Nesterenkonia flava TaxID=469799 RepID=A0ABU1FVY9_9MICC|nr:3-hydroxyacyl-CoA dehydrogenase NAD-binding domain-containing protein [Nesterenkonia flava]MDR5712402.1 3-hydroxyacyl-CoA dehydrogenase NAD-binding domain-containing protein [Nesterenkonia flava]
MTSFSQYAALAEAFSSEVVTHSTVEDVQLPGEAGTLALIRLDNDHPKRPSTLGPRSLIEFGEAVQSQAERAEAGEIAGLAVIGKPGVLAAGADIVSAQKLEEHPQAREFGIQLAALGHDAYNALADFPAPTFAFINGTALGGGLELALAADYRTVAAGAKAIGLPETFLGLVPGWGGIYRLPLLIGPEKAAAVIFTNPLNNNTTLRSVQAYDLGIADALLEDDGFETASIEFAARVISDEAQRVSIDQRRQHDGGPEAWERAVETARDTVATKTGSTAPGPLRALEIFEQVPRRSREEDREAEVAALGELLVTDEFRNVVYGFMELVQKRAKKPAGVPDVVPQQVRKVGVVGAGLMASQLALVFAQQMQVPVVLTDLAAERVDKALSWVREQASKQVQRGRLNPEQAEAVVARVTGSTDTSVYADADLVIEAVFEQLEVKKQVFADLEAIVSADTILATNTSSLSVTAMAEELSHPERVIGFHFFNPVAVMPLIEIARTDETSEAAIATAFDVASRLRKTPVLTKDATAFVVNRVLLRLMSEAQRAFDDGTDVHAVDEALKPLALPMSPFELLQMVGLPVAQHVTESLRSSFGERFYVSGNLQALIDAGVTTLVERDAQGMSSLTRDAREIVTQGTAPQSPEQVRTTALEALAQEIDLLLQEEVVSSPKDLDLCMILGAGWPFHRGGITPYLDQQGVSERVTGRRFGHR